MNTTTSYILAAVSVGCICLIRVCVRKIRSFLSDYYSSSSESHSSDKNINNKKNPIFI
jgi:hypothetical protein